MSSKRRCPYSRTAVYNPFIYSEPAAEPFGEPSANEAPNGLSLAYVERQNHSVYSGTTWAASTTNIKKGDFLLLRDHAMGGYSGWLGDPGVPSWGGTNFVAIRNHLVTLSSFWPFRDRWSYMVVPAGGVSGSITNLIECGGGHASEHSKRQLIVVRPTKGKIKTVHILQNQYELVVTDPSPDTMTYSSYDTQVPLLGVGLVGNWHTIPAAISMTPNGNAKTISIESFAGNGSWMGFGLDIINKTGDKATTTVDQTDANSGNALGSLIIGFNRKV